jgi:hypothetical protein
MKINGGAFFAPVKENKTPNKSRDQERRLVVRERTPNYYYLAPCVYQLIEAGVGGIMG